MKRTINRANSRSEEDNPRDQEQKRPRIDGESEASHMVTAQLEATSNIIHAGRDVIIQANAGKQPGDSKNTSTIDRHKLADWLSPHNFHTIHKDTYDKVTLGTGEWVFTLPEYISWLGKESDTLWGTGAPGAGKTCLSAVVIDYLIKKPYPDGLPKPVIFIYCQYKEQLTTAQIFASLLKQLVEKSPEVAQFIDDTLYSDCKKTNTLPSRLELLTTLQVAVKMFNRLFIIVDALDELDRSTYQAVVAHLMDLQKSLFITSRPLSLSRLSSPHFKIRAPPEDFQTYIHTQLSCLSEIEMLMDGELMPSIVDRIESKADGMFLVTALQLSALLSSGITSPQDLYDAIEGLPSSLDENYAETLKRICSKGATERSLAQYALLLVTHAAHVLRVEELLEALAVDLQSTTFNKQKCPFKHALNTACLGLLRIDEESQTVHLIHYTAQDFLEKQNILLPPNPHMQMANLCAAYVYQTCPDFRIFKSEVGHIGWWNRQNSKLDEIEKEHSFFAYAIRHIGHHTCKAGLTAHNRLPDKVHYLFTEYSPVLLLPEFNGFEYIDFGNMVHFAAWHGFQAILAASLEQSSLELQTTSLTSPLFYACLGGQASIVQELLKGEYLQIGLEEAFNVTCLHVNAQKGNAEITRLLVGLKSAQEAINELDEQSRTALHLAAAGGQDTVVQALLSSSGVDANAKDKSEQTALHVAAKLDDDTVVQVLLNCLKVDVNAQDKYEQTALHVAVKLGNDTVVQMFLNCLRVDVNAKDKSKQTALHVAAELGNDTVAQMLLSCLRVNVNTKDEYEQTALHVAAGYGHNTVVQLLLNCSGFDVNATDAYEQTALHVAAKLRHDTVVQVLLNCLRIDVNAKDKYEQTALYLSAKLRHDTVVQVLLNCPGVDVNAQTYYGHTALHEAARFGCDTIVQLLLNYPGVDVNAKGQNGWTALHYAASGGSNAVVQLLLNYPGVDVSAKDRHGWTALYTASEAGHMAVVRSLLEYPHIDVPHKDRQRILG